VKIWSSFVLFVRVYLRYQKSCGLALPVR